MIHIRQQHRSRRFPVPDALETWARRPRHSALRRFRSSWRSCSPSPRGTSCWCGAWSSIAVALAAAAATVLARRMAGVTAAVTTMLMSYWDYSFLGTYVPCVMTEGVSILAVMLLVWALILVTERKRLVLVGFTGLMTGFLILARSIFVLFLPGLLIMMVAAWQWRGKASDRRLCCRRPVSRRHDRHGSTLVGQELHRPGEIHAPGYSRWLPHRGGYSDLAVERRGFHTTQVAQEIWDNYSKENDVTGLTRLELERTKAEVGQREAIRWMRGHWAELPRLAYLKAETEWRGWRPRRQLVLVGLWILASLVTWRTPPSGHGAVVHGHRQYTDHHGDLLGGRPIPGPDPVPLLHPHWGRRRQVAECNPVAGRLSEQDASELPG